MKAKVVLLGLMALVATGCSASRGGQVTTSVVRQEISELERDPVPGTVNDIWAEPMIDTVKVPGQIDARRTYYRKAHTVPAEIRPGRFQLVEYPNDRPAENTGQ